LVIEQLAKVDIVLIKQERLPLIKKIENFYEGTVLSDEFIAGKKMYFSLNHPLRECYTTICPTNFKVSQEMMCQ
jgi:hypothetical protein